MVSSLCVCNYNLYCNVACWPFSHACADPAAPIGDFRAKCRLTYLLHLSVGTLRRLWHVVFFRRKTSMAYFIVHVWLHPWASFAWSVFSIKDFVVLFRLHPWASFAWSVFNKRL
jgi:hypothetical protein